MTIVQSKSRASQPWTRSLGGCWVFRGLSRLSRALRHLQVSPRDLFPGTIVPQTRAPECVEKWIAGLNPAMTFGLQRKLGLAGLLLIALLPATVNARDATATPPTRPADVDFLKAYDVLERHCARCHQSGRLQNRAKPAAEFGNILRVDEVARDAHLVRPGNPDASRLYTLMLGRRMPYDVYHEGASQEPPSADDTDVMRGWIAGLKPASIQSVASCTGRTAVSNDALQIAIAQDVERLPADQAARVRYVTLTELWSACAGDAYLEAARKVATVLLSGLSRGPRPVQPVPVNSAKTILRVDLVELQWTAQEWDRLAGLSPYVQPSAFAITARGPSVSSAVLAAAQPVRLDWLAFLLAEETGKRAAQAPGLTSDLRAWLQGLSAGQSGLSKLRLGDPAAFRTALVQSGIDPAPAYDQIDMADLLARHHTRDISPGQAAAEFGTSTATLESLLEGGPPEGRGLLLRLAQGAVSRSSFETEFAAISGYLLGQEPPDHASKWVRDAKGTTLYDYWHAEDYAEAA